MRVGVDVRATQFSSNRSRGIDMYVSNMVDSLVEGGRDHELILLVLPGLELPERLKELAATGKCATVVVDTRPLRPYKVINRLPKLWRLQYLLQERKHARQLSQVIRTQRLDVLHLAAPSEPRIFSTLPAPHGSSCRVVMTAYDLTPLVMSDAFFRPGSGHARFVYMRQLRAYRQADEVVAISASAGDDFVRLGGVDRTKVRVVHCGVPESFAPVPVADELTDCLVRHRIDSPYFLFCSGAGPNKNRARVVDAFGLFLEQRQDRRFQLIFVGPDADHDMTELKRIAFDRGVTRDQFRAIGFVPDEDLVRLFAGAKALVTPSLYEGFGLPAAQAMLVGTPVIASNRSSHPEVVGDAGLLVEPEDVEAIAAAMTRIADDAALRQDLVARGLDRAKRFRLPAQTALLMQAYSPA